MRVAAAQATRLLCARLLINTPPSPRRHEGVLPFLSWLTAPYAGEITWIGVRACGRDGIAHPGALVRRRTACIGCSLVVSQDRIGTANTARHPSVCARTRVWCLCISRCAREKALGSSLWGAQSRISHQRPCGKGRVVRKGDNDGNGRDCNMHTVHERFTDSFPRTFDTCLLGRHNQVRGQTWVRARTDVPSFEKLTVQRSVWTQRASLDCNVRRARVGCFGRARVVVAQRRAGCATAGA